ncbi:Imm32 family immunity protein [Pseudomonas taetrolens]|uniref:Imm32 family immunity protein n=1 Tax=Pseudomonas taetrolens TaxID=47884 RepID=UPI0030D79A0B
MKIKKFTIHGTKMGEQTEMTLDEISIVAPPETLRNIGLFLVNAAYEMERHGVEHIHLQDVFENFSSKDHVDIIALNNLIIQTPN